MAQMQGPIATEFYVEDPEGEVEVHFPDQSGETTGYDARLRRGTLEDLGAGTLYIAVDYELSSPYAEWDCEEINARSFADDLGFEPAPPRKFAEAVIVFTPKAKLI